jgi:hypothetical protein
MSSSLHVLQQYLKVNLYASYIRDRGSILGGIYLRASYNISTNDTLTSHIQRLESNIHHQILGLVDSMYRMSVVPGPVSQDAVFKLAFASPLYSVVH